jgi:hypothetical protein
MESIRVVDRDRPRTVAACGEPAAPAEPVTPEWLPLKLELSCSSKGMSDGIRNPDLYFSTVSLESYQQIVVVSIAQLSNFEGCFGTLCIYLTISLVASQ